jgi:hypothetical protein
MTLRTTLLAVCMVSVPAAALFSHRLPAGVRSGIREAAAAGVAWCRDAVCPPAPPVAVDRGVAADRVADGTSPADPPGTPAPTRPAGRSGNNADLLVGLGAMSLECRPLPGPQGAHVASCSMPLDAQGQLVRVFHAVGGDPEEAFAALHAEVDGWRLRAAGTPRRAAATSLPAVH